jgi:hypothetical protein
MSRLRLPRLRKPPDLAMADYHSLLAKAVDALDPNTPGARQRIYHRARSAMCSTIESTVKEAGHRLPLGIDPQTHAEIPERRARRSTREGRVYGGSVGRCRCHGGPLFAIELFGGPDHLLQVRSSRSKSVIVATQRRPDRTPPPESWRCRGSCRLPMRTMQRIGADAPATSRWAGSW